MRKKLTVLVMLVMALNGCSAATDSNSTETRRETADPNHIVQGTWVDDEGQTLTFNDGQVSGDTPFGDNPTYWISDEGDVIEFTSTDEFGGRNVFDVPLAQTSEGLRVGGYTKEDDSAGLAGTWAQTREIERIDANGDASMSRYLHTLSFNKSGTVTATSEIEERPGSFSRVSASFAQEDERVTITWRRKDHPIEVLKMKDGVLGGLTFSRK